MKTDNETTVFTLLNYLCVNGAILSPSNEDLRNYAVQLLNEGKLRMKTAYSDSINWFGTVMMFDDEQFTSRDFVSDIKLPGFVGEQTYPLCVAVAEWTTDRGKHKISIGVPPKNQFFFFNADDGNEHVKCTVPLTGFAVHLTPEKYLKLATAVRDECMMPSMSMMVIYFNESGVRLLLDKIFELAKKCS